MKDNVIRNYDIAQLMEKLIRYNTAYDKHMDERKDIFLYWRISDLISNFKHIALNTNYDIFTLGFDYGSAGSSWGGASSLSGMAGFPNAGCRQ